MDILTTNASGSLFSATMTQSHGLESLANSALQRGIDAYTHGDYAKAVSEFKRSVGLGRNSAYGADAAEYLAMAYIQQEDPDNAVKAYQAAIQIDPSRDGIHVKLGNLFFSQGKYDDARSEYAEAVRLNPSTANRYSLGQAYIELGRYAEAADQYNEIQRVAPREAGGYLGMGLTLSRQSRYEEAVAQFEQAIDRNPDLHDAYAQKGYAYADLGDMENAQKMVAFLEKADQLDLADTLSRYMYKVDPPKMVMGLSGSSFFFAMGKETPLLALNSYLMTPGASKTFTMQLMFDKAMDRASIENPLNWQIRRATGQGPGQAYNFGLAISPNEAQLPPIPSAVTWNERNLTATVYFTLTQNADANAAIDPSHIEFTFSGKDVYELKMNPKFDQFTGFSGVF